MKNRSCVCLAFLLGLSTSSLVNVNLCAAEHGPLAVYVRQPDASFRWVKRRDGTIGQAAYAELILTSQTWRGVAWKHQLFVIKPSTAPAECTHALLYIAGGSWRAELDRAPGDDARLPREARMIATLAEWLGTPVAVLMQVPHQPLFDGKYEDQIIAYTFDKYFETHDSGWPLLLPMVKSAVRAMDAAGQFAADEWSLDVKSFTLTGASKRGWTTWLTGAVDGRATAIAPMVIDVLNMEPQLRHQVEAWGGLSYKIKDYTDRQLHQRMQSDAGRSLRDIVDPYSYRRQLNQPKLIIIGTNDHYWPIDALNLYWDDLAGSNYIMYVPNNRHALTDYGRIAGSITALHRHAAAGTRLPKLSWRFARAERTVTLRIESDIQPSKVQVWVATSGTRDFRESLWTAHPSGKADGAYVFEYQAPATGYAALFGEAVYGGSQVPYFFSTNVRVIGPARP